VHQLAKLFNRVQLVLGALIVDIKMVWDLCLGKIGQFLLDLIQLTLQSRHLHRRDLIRLLPRSRQARAVACGWLERLLVILPLQLHEPLVSVVKAGCVVDDIFASDKVSVVSSSLALPGRFVVFRKTCSRLIVALHVSLEYLHVCIVLDLDFVTGLLVFICVFLDFVRVPPHVTLMAG